MKNNNVKSNVKKYNQCILFPGNSGKKVELKVSCDQKG